MRTRKPTLRLVPLIAMCIVATVPTIWYVTWSSAPAVPLRNRPQGHSVAAPAATPEIRELKSLGAYEAKVIQDKLKQYISLRSFASATADNDGALAALRAMLADAAADGADTVLVPNPKGHVGIANFPGPPASPTVLVYVHADVVPAPDDMFSPAASADGRLHGRGATDDKGPAAIWLGVPRLFARAGRRLPVTLRVVIDGAEEVGSPTIDHVLRQPLTFTPAPRRARREGGTAAADRGSGRAAPPETAAPPSTAADGVVLTIVSDSYCPLPDAPCLTASLRGVVAFEVTATGAPQDLHSGVHGGAVPEPLVALAHVVSRLVSPQGRVTVEGVSDSTPTLSPQQTALVRGAGLPLSRYAASVGLPPDRLLHSSSAESNAHRWLRPALTLHGYRGAWSGPGRKPVIPGTVTALLSVRTPPGQTATDVVAGVCAAVQSAEEDTRGVKLRCDAVHSADAWEGDPSGVPWSAVVEGVAMATGTVPAIVGGGGTISVVSRLERILPHAHTVLLPMAAADTGAHSDAEFIRSADLERGVVAAAAALVRIEHHYAETPDYFGRSRAVQK